jgi:hypothetical protein
VMSKNLRAYNNWNLPLSSEGERELRGKIRYGETYRNHHWKCPNATILT